MDHCRIDDRWQYNGLRAIVMESDLLRIVVLADHGAKIHEFVYKPRDRDFLYHNPRSRAISSDLWCQRRQLVDRWIGDVHPVRVGKSLPGGCLPGAG